MRTIFLALCLAGCTTAAIPPSPATVADRTVLDEQAIGAVELAYKAARLAIETGVDAGRIRGASAVRFSALNAKAYAAVQVARKAYAAGNAADYLTAIVTAKSAVADLLSLAK